jgi:shikimate dehydrogenase
VSSQPVRQIALIGDPVAHSISPALQQAAFDNAGVAYEYVVESITAEQLSSVFPNLPARYAGLNVTRPLKELVLPLLDEVSPEARVAGSVNTIEFDTDHGVARGFTTDGDGLVAALRRVHDQPVNRVVIVGTGGASRAIAATLAPTSSVTVIGRNRVAGERLARDLGAAGREVNLVTAEAGDTQQYRRVLDGCDLLVNATPLGGPGHRDDSPLPGGVLPAPGTVVFDLISIPYDTPLLGAAAAAGCPVVHGIEMLIEQGALAFTVWTGLPAPVDTMRQAAYRAANIQPAPTVVG